MKQYVVDEIRPSDFEVVKKYLDTHWQPQPIDDLYRISLSEALYSDIQKAHEDCQPYYFAIELKTDAVCAELLVRSEKIIRCDCIAYATDMQRQWLMDTIDAMFSELQIIT
jgi:hypothetical protein